MDERPLRGMIKWMALGLLVGMILFGGFHLLFHEPPADEHLHPTENAR